MAKVYIKKVNVVNGYYFKKIGVDPAKLSLSQRNFTDRLITLVKPCSKSSILRDSARSIVLNFIEATNGKDRHQIKHTFQSIIYQINHNCDGNDSRKEYKFNIMDYDYGQVYDKLVELNDKAKMKEEEGGE